MKRREHRFKEWVKSAGITLAAAMIVAAILGIVLYNAPGPIASKALVKGSRESRPSATLERDGRPGLGRPTARSGSSPVHRGGNQRAENDDAPGLLAADSRAHSEPREEDESGETEDATSPSVSTAMAGAKPAGAAPKSGSAARKMTEARWEKDIRLLHSKFCKPGRGSEAAKREVKEKAEAALEAIDDPKAVVGIWKVLAGSPSHHQLVARMLARIESPLSTRRLAELSVFSSDEKARGRAIGALKSRDPADFLGPLTSMFDHVKWHRDFTDHPGIGREEALIIERDRAIYRFVYPPPAKAPPPRDSQGVYGPDNPFMLQEDRQTAVRINQAHEADARATLAEQIKGDIEKVKRFEQECHELNDRAVKALREATGASNLPPDRAAWKRWFAELKGSQYLPRPDPQKELIVQLMPPLFNPSFISIPEPT